MVEVLPFPWDTLRRLQTATDSWLVNPRTKGREEALLRLVEELAAGKVPSSPEVMERRYRTLSANRAVKYRHRTTVAGRVAYEHRVQHVDLDPSELTALKELTVLVAAKLAPQDCWLMREIGDGASYREVAQELGMPVGTVKARVSRLRHYMRNTEVAKIIRQTFEAA